MDSVANAAEAPFSTAKISVWWDMRSCEVPNSSKAYAIADNIHSALTGMNYCGPISIFAYSNIKSISETVLEDFSIAGVSIIHVPATGTSYKDAIAKRMFVDMMSWALDNPAPANYLLISGDNDFSYTLRRLMMSKYNILLALPQLTASAPMVAAAKSVWFWNTLLVGGPPLSYGDQKTTQRSHRSY